MADDEKDSFGWRHPPPGRLIGRGHPAGDFVEAHDWELLEESDGRLRISAHLPDRVKNPRGQLFGGFTPTYVDLVALFTARAGRGWDNGPHWMATTNMRVDYLAPVTGPKFFLDSVVVHRRKKVWLVETRFLDPQDELLVFALTNLLEIEDRPRLGDG